MMTFVNMHSPGLKILATHRLVSGVAGFDAGEFIRQAAAGFEVAQIPGVEACSAPGRIRPAAPSSARPSAAAVPDRSARFRRATGRRACCTSGCCAACWASAKRPCAKRRTCATCAAWMRRWRGPQRRRAGRLPAEAGFGRRSGAHLVWRRRDAPEVHRFLSEAAFRPDHL
jgi:hypothetical protein